MDIDRIIEIVKQQKNSTSIAACNINEVGWMVIASDQNFPSDISNVKKDNTCIIYPNLVMDGYCFNINKQFNIEGFKIYEQNILDNKVNNSLNIEPLSLGILFSKNNTPTTRENILINQ